MSSTVKVIQEYKDDVMRHVLGHCDHMGYKFTYRNWREHYNKLPLEQVLTLMIDEAVRMPVDTSSDGD